MARKATVYEAMAEQGMPVVYTVRNGAARFECGGCGEHFLCEPGKPGRRTLPVCECGRAWLITYTSGPDASGNGTATMAED